MATVENNNKSGAIKIAGYLEKKRRKRVVSKWKKYWFVLEGRLLLYYKSHFEVTNLCPCRGSINMGVAISVRPLNSQTHSITGIYMFEIVTHTNKRVLLRTKEKQIQEQWLQALLDALGGQPKLASSRVHHFRYSLDSLTLSPQKSSQSGLQFRRQYTLPQNIKNIELHRTKTFLGHLKSLTGRHTRSLDAILKKSKETEFMSTIRDDTSESSSSINEKDLDENEPQITKYRSLESISLNKGQEILKNKTDKNENCIIENDTYECVTAVSSSTLSTNNNTDEENWPSENVKIEINELYDENRNERKVESVMIENSLYEFDNAKSSQDSNSKTNSNDTYNAEEIYAECDNDNDMKADSNKSSELDIETNIEKKTDENNEECYSTTYDYLNNMEEDVYADIDEKTLTPGLPPPRCNKQIDDNWPSEKKKKMFQLKFKFTKKDPTNKINKSLTPKTKQKAIRKESFMNKLFKHNKKKADSEDSIAKDDNGYMEINPINDNDDNDKVSQKTITPVTQKKVCGAQVMLTQSTMQELNEKLNLERKKVLSRCYSDENDGIYEAIDTGQTNNKTEEIPGLPPRKGSRQRSRSPWHDVPTNNTPYSKQRSHHETIVSPNDYNNLEHNESSSKASSSNFEHLYSEVNKSTKKKEELEENKIDSSELSVKQLIHRFDESKVCVDDSKDQLKSTSADDDVILRKDNCLVNLSDDYEGRNSEELNVLLNELSKITIAPLVQPRVINSLIQVKPTQDSKDNKQNHHSSCTPLSDEEWLALGPIRRRRYSEPDYDVPRSHRSLDFVPPLPPKTNSTISELNTTTPKFFNQPLNSTPIICDSIEPPSIAAWSRSITPDSLEPNDTHHHSIRKHEELDRSMGIETIAKNSPLVSIKENAFGFLEHDKKNNDVIHEKFFDSLENTTSF
ncbi:putative uncharacterized protein DDB_G0282133 isoform X2 [Chrysoperla carnea]|uniref:putative uncharacterized protein DDB_G0282133 isoform X2 n=1 Tax=Chrysoperla carnea TaxID=189513 RepID=UPI001D08E38A|nr:putative uncharacterized protein DDB_G0282133 isoform X2 [Chrysoperla carnea]